jgi:hypothetical protein
LPKIFLGFFGWAEIELPYLQLSKPREGPSLNTRGIYVHQLIPALEAFLKHYASRDLNAGEDIASAFRLAEILNSLPERVMLESPRPAEVLGFADSKAYRAHARKEFPTYGFVVDFANALKHEKLSGLSRTIDGLSQVETRIATCIYRDALGQYEATVKLLWLRQKADDAVDLRRALVMSAVYWTDKLVSYGIIEPVDPQRFTYTEHVTRAEAAQLSNLRLHGVAHEPLQTQCVVLEYDYGVGGLIAVKKGTVFDHEFAFDSVISSSPFLGKD